MNAARGISELADVLLSLATMPELPPGRVSNRPPKSWQFQD